MKNVNKIVMAAFVALAFTAANHAQADEPFLSPRAKANQIHHVPGNPSANDHDLVREIRDKNGSPKSKGEWSWLNSWVILSLHAEE